MKSHKLKTLFTSLLKPTETSFENNRKKILLTGFLEYSDSILEKKKTPNGSCDFNSSFKHLQPYFSNYAHVVGFTSSNASEDFCNTLINSGFTSLVKTDKALLLTPIEDLNINILFINAEMLGDDNIYRLPQMIKEELTTYSLSDSQATIGYIKWDKDRNPDPNEKQKKIVDVLCRCNLDFLVGTNETCIQPYTLLENKGSSPVPVIYSLGSFFTANNKKNERTGIILEIEPEHGTNNKTLLKAKYLPSYVMNQYNGIGLFVIPITKKLYPSGQITQLLKEQERFAKYAIGMDALPPSTTFGAINEKKIPSNYKFPPYYIDSQIDADEIFNGTVYYENSTSLQMNIFNVLKTHDDFKRYYGEYIIAHSPYGDGVQSAIKQIKKFKKTENVSISTHRDLIIDLIYMRNIFGFYYVEYFCYGFENKSLPERLEFMCERSLSHYFGKLNKNPNAVKLLNDKYQSYLRFREFYGRDIIELKSSNEIDTFLSFAHKHGKFIVKPKRGLQGKGIRIIDISEIQSLENTFSELINDGTIVCEELISQSQSMSILHPHSVNTVRMFTYFNGIKAKPVLAWLKTGRGGAIVDNGSAGGLIAAIDISTATVSTNGCDERGSSFERHPDTHVVFKGFKIEQWEHLCETTCLAAEKIPELHIVGWDVALTDTGWKIIEGNAQGGIFVQQFATQKGILKDFLVNCEWYKYKDL